jgi:ElaB/YqjD/DUF883 family membrane-anchored ribosome-binding protein
MNKPSSNAKLDQVQNTMRTIKEQVEALISSNSDLAGLKLESITFSEQGESTDTAEDREATKSFENATKPAADAAFSDEVVFTEESLFAASQCCRLYRVGSKVYYRCRPGHC